MASIDVEEANIGIRDDEVLILKHYKYRGWVPVVISALMFGVAKYADMKWVVATGFAVLITVIIEQDGRHFAIAVRIARTNLLLRDIIYALSKRPLS